MDVLKEIPPLLPQFLRKRRVGLPAVDETYRRLGVERPALFMMIWLREVQGSYGGEPVTPAQLRVRARYVYSTIDTYTPLLTALKEKGFLLEDPDGGLALSPAAWEAVDRLHDAGRAYVARHRPLPDDTLQMLAHQLERAVAALLADPVLSPRPGSHLAGARSLAVFGDGAPAMVRTEQAIFDLWMARDDSHLRAWREAGLEGPPMQVLTLLWQGEASTATELQNILASDQTPADMESSLAFLLDKDYITRSEDVLELTPAGVLVREDIERETDRVYFASWPHTQPQAEWLRDTLSALVTNLSPPV
jgi:hypothetical protein